MEFSPPVTQSPQHSEFEQEVTCLTYFGPKIVRQCFEKTAVAKIEKNNCQVKTPLFDSICEQTNAVISTAEHFEMAKEEIEGLKSGPVRTGLYSLFEDVVISELLPLNSVNSDMEKVRETCAKLSRSWSSVRKRLKVLSKLSASRLAKLVHIAKWNIEKSKIVRVMVERSKADNNKNDSSTKKPAFIAKLVPYNDTTTKNKPDQVLSLDFVIQQFNLKMDATTVNNSHQETSTNNRIEIEAPKPSLDSNTQLNQFTTPPNRPKAALSNNFSEYISESHLEYKALQENIRVFIASFAVRQLKNRERASRLLVRIFNELCRQIRYREFIDEDENLSQKHAAIFLGECTNALMRADFQSRFFECFD
jgi:hypothetical protein